MEWGNIYKWRGEISASCILFCSVLHCLLTDTSNSSWYWHLLHDDCLALRRLKFQREMLAVVTVFIEFLT
jgi:hypothetical protein